MDNLYLNLFQRVKNRYAHDKKCAFHTYFFLILISLLYWCHLLHKYKLAYSFRKDNEPYSDYHYFASSINLTHYEIATTW